MTINNTPLNFDIEADGKNVLKPGDKHNYLEFK